MTIILVYWLSALVSRKLTQSSGKHDQSSDKTFRRKETPDSFPSQTPKNTMTHKTSCKINLRLFQTFWNIFNSVHPSTSNLFKPFQKPLLKDPLHQNFFGVPGTAHHSWCTAPPLEQDLPRLRHLTAPHPGWVQLLFDLQQFLDSLEMFGDVGKIGGYKENPSPIFSGFWGHIHHWDGHSAIAFVVALHSNWEAGDVHIHHSDIIVSELLQQTKPNQLKLIIRMTGLSNVWIFQKNKYKLNHISLSLSVKLAPKIFHRKLPLKIKPHAQLPPPYALPWRTW